MYMVMVGNLMELVIVMTIWMILFQKSWSHGFWEFMVGLDLEIGGWLERDLVYELV
jgi:hypothetical protein